jgi:chromodomain-helicase-DNA-binding protein 1
MTSSQQLRYRWLLTKNFAKLDEGTSGKGMGLKTTLRNIIMELKKIRNVHFPFGNVEDITVKTTVETLIRASGKMTLLDKLLPRLREKGHRVLFFSQMMRMVDIMSDYCRMRGFPFQRLDGTMPNDLRVRSVDHCNAPESTDYVFLLSTRAGVLGINLATADAVSYLTQTGIRRTTFGWNIVRIASEDKGR